MLGALYWQLLDLFLAQLPWAKDYQPSRQPDYPHASTSHCEPSTDTLRKPHSNHSCLLLKHNSGFWKPCPSHNCFKQLVRGFLPSQVSMNSKWPCSQSQAKRGACPCCLCCPSCNLKLFSWSLVITATVSAAIFATATTLLFPPSSLCVKDSHDWCPSLLPHPLSGYTARLFGSLHVPA
jgi:hypothetical protein